MIRGVIAIRERSKRYPRYGIYTVYTRDTSHVRYVYLYGQTTSRFSGAKPGRLIPPLNHAGFLQFVYTVTHRSQKGTEPAKA